MKYEFLTTQENQFGVDHLSDVSATTRKTMPGTKNHCLPSVLTTTTDVVKNNNAVAHAKKW